MDEARRRSEHGLYRRAVRQSQHRSFHQARASFEQLVRIAPHDGRNWLAFAKMESRAGDLKRARELLRLGVRKSSAASEPILLHAHAVLEERAGHVSAARKLFRRCLALDPNDLVTYQALALLESRQNCVQDASAIFKRGAARIDAQHSASTISSRSGGADHDRTGRGANSTTATTTTTTTASFWNAYGVFLQNRVGDLAGAAGCFERATGVDPQHVRSWQAWAVCEERRGNRAEARELFEAALRIDSHSAPTFQAYGLFEARRGDAHHARELFRRGLKADAQHAPLLHAWARLEEREGNVTTARKLFERGARVDPTNAVMLRSWACLEIKSGHIDSSEPAWRDPFLPAKKVPKRQLARYAERLSMVRRLVERKTADDVRVVLSWLASNKSSPSTAMGNKKTKKNEKREEEEVVGGQQANTLLQWAQRRSKQDVEAFTVWFAKWYEQDRRIVSYIFGWDIPPASWEQDAESVTAGSDGANGAAADAVVEVPVEWYTLMESPRQTLRDADDELFNDDAVAYSVLAEFFGTFASNLANRTALSCALLGFSVLLVAAVSNYGLLDMVPPDSADTAAHILNAPRGVDAHLIDLHDSDFPIQSTVRKP